MSSLGKILTGARESFGSSSESSIEVKGIEGCDGVFNMLFESASSVDDDTFKKLFFSIKKENNMIGVNSASDIVSYH